MDSIIHRLDNCNFFTDPLFSLYGSLSARMKIKTAGNLLPVCAWGRGKGKEKIVRFFFFLALRPRSRSRCTRVRVDFQK